MPSSLLTADHFHYSRRNSMPICNHSPFSLPPAFGNHQPISCLYRFAYSGYFIQVDLYTIWFFVPGFFHLVFSFVQIIAGISFFFHSPEKFHCMDKSLFVYLVIKQWTFECLTFGLLWICFWVIMNMLLGHYDICVQVVG